MREEIKRYIEGKAILAQAPAETPYDFASLTRLVLQDEFKDEFEILSTNLELTDVVLLCDMPS